MRNQGRRRGDAGDVAEHQPTLGTPACDGYVLQGGRGRVVKLAAGVNACVPSPFSSIPVNRGMDWETLAAGLDSNTNLSLLDVGST